MKAIMKIFLFLLFLTSLKTSLALSKVIETYEYSEIFPHIEKMIEKYGKDDVLVVFDIDDTLLVIEHCIHNGKRTRGIGKLYHCPSEHTEKNLSRKIKELQEKGIDTLALTARGKNLVKATERELSRRHGRKPKFDFNFGPFRDREESFKVAKTRRCKRSETPPCLKEGEFTDRALLKKGVFYASGSHKGLGLQAILDRDQRSYSGIVFIDDRKKNTKNMSDSFKKNLQVELLAFLYLKHRD